MALLQRWQMAALARLLSPPSKGSLVSNVRAAGSRSYLILDRSHVDSDEEAAGLDALPESALTRQPGHGAALFLWPCWTSCDFTY